MMDYAIALFELLSIINIYARAQTNVFYLSL